MYRNILFKKNKNNRSNEDIYIEDLKNILKTNKESIIIDVRSPLEYKEGHLNRIN